MMERILYFAYGSNMSTEYLKKPDRAPSAKPLGRAKVTGKRLVCNKKSKDGSGKANLEDAPGDTVWGVLHEINPAELDELDNAEKGYKRESFNVTTDQGSSVKVFVYVSSLLTDDPRPYDWYKELIIKGAREHDLPESYIKKVLEQLVSKPDLSK